MSSEASVEAKEILKEAIALHRDGDLTNSERLYTKVLDLDPEQTDAMQLLGVIAAQMGNTPLAIERVNQSIAINPNQPGALNNLGNMLADEERYDDAIDAYERAIHFSPSNSQAYFHLGHVLGYADRQLESVTAYTRASELDPENASTWNALGAALEKVGRPLDAIEAFKKSIAIDNEYISPKDGLGMTLRQLGRLDEALEVYQQWLSVAPENPIAKHFAMVCAPNDKPDRASADYVKKTFDGFAESFDSLLSELDYQVPNLLGDMIKRNLTDEDQGQLKIVDLGCGTGLCGQYLRGFAEHLVGVDLSPNMLHKASQREEYDELVESELTEYLSGCPYNFDLVVSADTLIYIGDLRSTFAAAANTMKPGGTLVFSLEKMEDDGASVDSSEEGFRLGHSGRYMHTEACLRQWLVDSGFTVEDVVESAVRIEGRSTVFGYLVRAVLSNPE